LARALSSPLRLRILRLCRFDARTNAELAELLDVNAATMLHHVRTLVRAGLLAADPERIGTRGAREVPYRATGLSWNTPVPGISVVLLEAMRQQLQGVDPEQVEVAWLGLRLNPEHRAELRERINELATEFKNRGPDPDGEAYSLVMVTHPDLNPPAEPAGPSR
jgi:DNA-binding transcriptional ArsR family regulator